MIFSTMLELVGLAGVVYTAYLFGGFQWGIAAGTGVVLFVAWRL